MRIDEFPLQDKNQIAASYSAADPSVENLYDYNGFTAEMMEQRISDIGSREYEREKLANYLSDYNFQFSCSKQTLTNIEKLRNPKSAAVIGGQQAGLLTGPLLTIHKCISIIQFACIQERQLGVPVVPVFWIAGEDHDYDEINHVNVERNGVPKKRSLPPVSPLKTSATLMEWDSVKAAEWAESVFREFGETEFTKEVLSKVKEIFKSSKTAVHSFAQFITDLFGEYGLVLVDSGEPHFKRLQTDTLEKMILRNIEVDEAFAAGIEQLTGRGFSAPVELQENNAHLFIYHNEERLLLFRDDSGNFLTKNEEVTITSEQLMANAKEKPELFSNNVVTRPVMQESLFPVLAFIAGSGEIAYWSALKEVFHLFSFKMPPLVPRLSMTIVTGKNEKQLKETGLKVEDVLREGTEVHKQSWYESHKPIDTKGVYTETLTKIEAAHTELKMLALTIDPSLKRLTDINLNRIKNEVDYLHTKMERSMKKELMEPLALFDHLQCDLAPDGVLQERVWNAFSYINRYGTNWIKQLTEQPLEFNGKHKLVYVR
ncbi:bacillithiol biosynthesis cysteine-adding enzyme BshC [Fictibacillus sp. KU28468]|uniref:bacillithiol biosynthesis cysteine-adding enzyme BshC n=1 Tax=Fictibacillus sp. KU28468 TaxID=2991053 RepID=UPI00223E2B28|nr:bacillithiol biosynthesis cysteine-adding enzyme BshC [Fictibacillus sp. KU28468]UZJ77262.1 bacillithiol biosynthesis cysteine-adding enzyme BshC [Fictibacillus sp. KU28468]